MKKLLLTSSALFLILLFSLTAAVPVSAQEEVRAIEHSRKYIDFNLKSLNKYSKRIARQQEKLLKRLKRKEDRLAASLKKSDSAAYAKYQRRSVTYDSIGKLLHPDSATLAKKHGNKSNASVDSIQKVYSFLQSNASEAGIAAPATEGNFNELQQRLNHNEYINLLITRRTNNLKRLASNSNHKILALKGIEKEVFYGKARMNTFKDMANEPSKLEEKAIEYLQGKEGFSFKEQNPYSVQALTSRGGSVTELEAMGLQTKRQVNEMMRQKYGSGVNGMQNKLGGQMEAWKGHLKELEAIKSEARDAKRSAESIRYINKPSFKVNPMRGLPFGRRIEKQFNWHTTRATNQGDPAMLHLAVLAGFRHTEKLTYGIGLATSVGLGQNWSNVRFSIQGVGLRTYAVQEIFAGIGIYAGYERMYKEAVFGKYPNEAAAREYTTHDTGKYSESALLGLNKSYSINDKWHGAVQVLYDIWWREKGLASPLQLRFSTSTN